VGDWIKSEISMNNDPMRHHTTKKCCIFPLIVVYNAVCYLTLINIVGFSGSFGFLGGEEK